MAGSLTPILAPKQGILHTGTWLSMLPTSSRLFSSREVQQAAKPPPPHQLAQPGMSCMWQLQQPPCSHLADELGWL